MSTNAYISSKIKSKGLRSVKTVKLLNFIMMAAFKSLRRIQPEKFYIISNYDIILEHMMSHLPGI